MLGLLRKGDVKSILDKLIDVLHTTSQTLETVDNDGQPSGSGWSVNSFDKLAMDIFPTKPIKSCS